MKIFCPFCGIANLPEATACRACGTPLPALSDGPAAGTQDGGSSTGAQILGNTVDYSFQTPDGYAVPPQPSWPQSEMTSSQSSPRFPHAAVSQPAWTPSNMQAPPMYGLPGRAGPNVAGGSVSPTGPFNGAYPAQYVPATPLPSGNVYLPGDPRATAQAQPGNVYLSGDPRASAPWVPGHYAGVPYSTYLQPAPVAAMPAYVQTGQPELADCGTRLGAFMLDTLALSVPTFILMGLAAATASTALATLTLMIMLFAPALYFVACWANGGQTLGYRALGLRLVRSDGSRPGVGAAVARCLGMLICLSMLVPGVLGFIWMLWDDRKQALHDKMGDTLVVKA